MSNQNRESLKVGKQSLKGYFKVVFFQEGDSYIYYIPSLNLSSYGDTLAEAEQMMKDIIIPDFCKNLLALPKQLIFRELKALGWERDKFFQNDLSKSSYIDKEGILREFDLAEGTIITEKGFSVAC